jgi:hypothetical protein
LKKHILKAWDRLRTTPFPDTSSCAEWVEIRAELANISTFGSGCVNAFLRRGRLGPGHHTILLNCLEALQRLDGKIALVNPAEDTGDPKEIRELCLYKESLERLLEAILISSAGPAGGNGS